MKLNFDIIKKAKEVIKKKGFKQQSSKKHVKTRTPYRAVTEYEKEFKYGYADMIGKMSTDFMTKVTKQLHEK